MRTKATSFTIPEFLFKEFDDYCKLNNLNKSAIMRGFIYKYLKEKIPDNPVVSSIIEVNKTEEKRYGKMESH